MGDTGVNNLGDSVQEKSNPFENLFKNHPGITRAKSIDNIRSALVQEPIEALNRETTSNSKIKMTTKVEFHNLCARTFNEVYSGEAQGLQAFISKIEGLALLVENNDPTSILLNAIKSNVKNFASEVYPKAPTTVKQVTDAFVAKIKPENSNVIVGNMMALRADRSNLSDYAKKTENLAQAYKPSLVSEGTTLEKANEMAVEKAVTLCKANTRSPIVLSTLNSTPFDNVKDVLAKYITVSREHGNESQVLYAQLGQPQKFNQNRRNFNQSSRGQQSNRFNNQNRSNFSNFNRNHGNFRGNSRGNFSNNRGNYSHNHHSQNRRGIHNANRSSNNGVYFSQQGNDLSPPSRETQNEVNWRSAENSN